jgi:hypothetical protein
VEAETIVSKLQGEAALTLARLCVEQLLQTEVGLLVPQEVVVSTGRAALQGWLSTPTATAALERVVALLSTHLQAERRRVGDVMPDAVRAALKDVVGRPFSPERKVVLTLIDRAPTRKLVRELLLEAILDFGKKASAPVAGVARGLGSLARLAGETVKSRGGGLGSLVGAVSDEVERQVEKRAVEFVDAALAGIFGKIADALSDPAQASDAAELRLAIFEGAMELTGPQLARELLNLDVPGAAQMLREGLAAWLSSSAATGELQALAAALLEGERHRPAKEVLAELGVLEVAREVATQQLATRIRSLAATGEFSAWLAALGTT